MANMKSIINFFSLLLIITLLGCSRSNENVQMARLEIEDDLMATSSNEEINESIERKLIKEGEVLFETDNISSSRKSIIDAVKKYKGYISSDREYKSLGSISNTIVIRVPTNDFDNLLAEATQGVEKFENKEINVKDVTEEFLDISARLKTKKELETRFLELLKQAKNVTEILAIESQIGDLRSEIESIEGRLNYLNDRISLSTLTMTFYENIPNESAFGQKFKVGFRNGWDNLIWFFVALVNAWPFLIIGLGLFFGIRRFRRK